MTRRARRATRRFTVRRSVHFRAETVKKMAMDGDAGRQMACVVCMCMCTLSLAPFRSGNSENDREYTRVGGSRRKTTEREGRIAEIRDRGKR